MASANSKFGRLLGVFKDTKAKSMSRSVLEGDEEGSDPMDSKSGRVLPLAQSATARPVSDRRMMSARRRKGYATKAGRSLGMPSTLG